MADIRPPEQRGSGILSFLTQINQGTLGMTHSRVEPSLS
jgi:hypothetical protein